MPRKKKKPPVPVGKKIKKARTSKKYTLDQVANETGFSIDYLKEVEAGKAIPPVGALLQIARALEIDSGSLLKEPESKMQSRIKAQTKRTEDYAYTTLTPGAENKHLKAFLVTIEAQHVNSLKAGESLHFNSGIRHKLKSVSDETAELIVVIYTP
jgi:transcriptional regulator with XRE-family HTH domain